MSDVACRLPPADQRRRGEELRAGLLRRVLAKRDLERGLELELPRSAEMLRELAEFVDFESRCCPFLDFELRVDAGGDRVRLRLTGPEGTRELLEGMLRPGAAA